MTIELFGISNCDSVKKAKRWFDDKGITYQFHDFRKDGLTAPMIEQWLQHCSWEQLINKRSTTWRQLDQQTKDQLGPDTIASTLSEHPTLVKRPVIQRQQQLLIGFDPKQYSKLFE